MAVQTFYFSGKIKGETKNLTVKVPVENGFALTNKYCPQELLTGGLNFITAQNGESIDEFIHDCKMQIAGIEGAGIKPSRLDVHIAGLMGVVMHHLSRCGRLIFGDLLIYMDCFSILLEADGFSEGEIKKLYPKVTRSVVESYPNLVFNTQDLSPFKGSHFDFILFHTERESK